MWTLEKQAFRISRFLAGELSSACHNLQYAPEADNRPRGPRRIHRRCNRPDQARLDVAFKRHSGIATEPSIPKARTDAERNHHHSMMRPSEGQKYLENVIWSVSTKSREGVVVSSLCPGFSHPARALAPPILPSSRKPARMPLPILEVIRLRIMDTAAGPTWLLDQQCWAPANRFHIVDLISLLLSITICRARSAPVVILRLPLSPSLILEWESADPRSSTRHSNGIVSV